MFSFDVRSSVIMMIVWAFSDVFLSVPALESTKISAFLRLSALTIDAQPISLALVYVRLPRLCVGLRSIIAWKRSFMRAISVSFYHSVQRCLVAQNGSDKEIPTAHKNLTARPFRAYCAVPLENQSCQQLPVKLRFATSSSETLIYILPGPERHKIENDWIKRMRNIPTQFRH